MSNYKVLVSCVLVGILLLFGSPLSAFAEGKSVSALRVSNVQQFDRAKLVKYRRIVMQIKGMHTQALKYLVKTKMRARPQIVSHAEALHNMTSDMLRLFFVESTSPKSRAKREIWDEQGQLTQEFIDLAQVMDKEVVDFLEVVKSNNTKAIQIQLRTFEKAGCDECHSKFRGGDPEKETK